MQNWINYWDTQTIFSHDEWEKNMDIFFDASALRIGYTPTDAVLDVGCGPGYLGLRLQGKIARYCGIDTSARYIEECRTVFSSCDDATRNDFFQIGEAYTDFSFLGAQKFDKIICLSVIQYYQSVAEVEQLFLELIKHGAPGAKILIADIITRENIFSDIWAVVKSSVARGKLLSTLVFLCKAQLSEYRATRKQNGLLAVPKSELERIIRTHGLSAEIFSDQMTLNTNRSHVLIYVD